MTQFFLDKKKINNNKKYVLRHESRRLNGDHLYVCWRSTSIWRFCFGSRPLVGRFPTICLIDVSSDGSISVKEVLLSRVVWWMSHRNLSDTSSPPRPALPGVAVLIGEIFVGRRKKNVNLFANCRSGLTYWFSFRYSVWAIAECIFYANYLFLRDNRYSKFFQLYLDSIIPRGPDVVEITRKVINEFKKF